MKPVPNTVVCRTEPSLCAQMIGVPVFGMGFALYRISVIFSAGIPAHPWTSVSFVSLICAFAVLALILLPILIWPLRARIVADHDGLRCRGFGPERRYRWDEIVDYSDSETRQGLCVHLKTPRREILLSPTLWTNLDALRSIVDARVKAPPTGWRKPVEKTGYVAGRVFGYSRATVVALGVTAIGGVGLEAFFMSLLLNARGSGLAPTLAAALFFGLLAAGVLVLSLGTLLRRDETIETSTDGIAFTKAGRTITARWDDTRYVVGIPEKVVTPDGTFTFDGFLDDAQTLRSILMARASSLPQPAPGASSEPALPWTLPLRPRDARENAAMAGVGVALDILLQWMARTVPGEIWFTLAIGAFLGGGAIVEWTRYAGSRLEMDSQRLVLRQPFRRTIAIRWQDVTRAGYLPGDRTLVYAISDGVQKMELRDDLPELPAVRALVDRLAPSMSHGHSLDSTAGNSIPEEVPSWSHPTQS